MWQKMVTKTEQGKKFVMELVEQSVAAYDQREDICNKIQNLDDRGQLENNVHMQVCGMQIYCSEENCRMIIRSRASDQHLK